MSCGARTLRKAQQFRLSHFRRFGVSVGSECSMKESEQPSLFDHDETLPEGCRYQRDLISAAEEQQLVREIETLPFEEFQFHGFVGKRRVVSFGWRYDFNESELQKADDMPAFLLPLRQRA